MTDRDTPSGAVAPRVVIAGAGFGGLWAARRLKNADLRVTLLDGNNYHLFQPLLYQVATAGLAPSDIAWPIRSVLSRQQNATVLMETVTGVDTANREVITDVSRIPYDYLVLATGNQPNWFGHDEWIRHAPGLKSIDDATSIRRRILLAFEKAEAAEDDAERRRLLTFVIVGAGPTGVELAGTIAELAQRALARDFRRIDSRAARIVLVEAGPRVLPTFGEGSSAYTLAALTALGVEVRLGTGVSSCSDDGVIVGGEPVGSATVLWAAGVRATPVGRWLDAATDRAGRVIVEPDLTVPGQPRVFVIGDAAAAISNGNPVPGVAPAAKQQGRYVAERILAAIRGAPGGRPFVYRDYGSFATIGRKAAVIELPFTTIRGYLAWWIWGLGHIYFLIGVRSPVMVALNWLRQYLTYGRGARLITGLAQDQRHHGGSPTGQ